MPGGLNSPLMPGRTRESLPWRLWRHCHCWTVDSADCNVIFRYCSPEVIVPVSLQCAYADVHHDEFEESTRLQSYFRLFPGELTIAFHGCPTDAHTAWVSLSESERERASESAAQQLTRSYKAEELLRPLMGQKASSRRHISCHLGWHLGTPSRPCQMKGRPMKAWVLITSWNHTADVGWDILSSSREPPGCPPGASGPIVFGGAPGAQDCFALGKERDGEDMSKLSTT